MLAAVDLSVGWEFDLIGLGVIVLFVLVVLWTRRGSSSEWRQTGAEGSVDYRDPEQEERILRVFDWAEEGDL